MGDFLYICIMKDTEKLLRICPTCNTSVKYNTITQLKRADKKNLSCWECSNKVRSSKLTKQPFTTFEVMERLLCVEWKSVGEIGKIFNRSKHQVNKCIHLLKVNRKNFKKQLHDEGKSICSNCLEIKLIDNFNINTNRSTLNGVKPICKDCEANIGKKWYNENDTITKQRAKKHRKDNPERHRELSRNKQAKYRKEKPHISRMRNILNRYVTAFNKNKESKTEEMLGYTFDAFKNHFETFSLSIVGNHIDHICPLSWFMSDVPANVVNSLDNLQILTEDENTIKSQRFSHPISESFFNKSSPYLLPEKRDRFILVNGFYVDKLSPFFI